MPNICLTFGTETDASTIRDALATLDGLNAWWTNQTTGDPAKDGTLTFTFGEHGGFEMRVIKNDQASVHWECINGPDEWVGTRIEFDIDDRETHNQLMFRHVGWASETGFFHHCSMKWATFLLSMRDHLEGGTGRPFPNDVKIEAVGT